MKDLKIHALLGALALFALPAHAAIIVDQQQTSVTAGFGFGAGGNTGIQSVTAGVNGTLQGFDIIANGIGLNASITIDVFVNVGAPLQADANDYEATVVLTSGETGSFFYVDVSSANILLNAGDQFEIGFTPQGAFDLGVGPVDSYTNGQFYFNGGLQTRDIAFRTHMDAIPEPGSLIFLSLGSLALLTRRRADTAHLHQA